MPHDRMSSPIDDNTPLSATNLPPLPDGIGRDLAECQTLPSLPAAAARVVGLARSDDPSLADFAKAIQQDPALTLRLISLANSALYSRAGSRVTTCHDAVSRLGLDATLATAMSFGLPKPGPQCCLDYGHLWQRAIIAAMTAKHLAQQLCPPSAGTLFTTALIQDIGILALEAVDGETYRRLIPDLYDHHALSAAERQHYGCDHALVGAWLALSWGVPEHLAASIARSHGPLEDGDPETLSIRLSCRVADSWLAAEPAPAFSELLRQLTGIETLDATQLANLMQELQERLPSIARLFEITCPPDIDCTALLTEAKQLLFEQNFRLSHRLSEQQRELEAIQASHTVLDKQRRTDHLTRLANRSWLEKLLAFHFDNARIAGQSLSVMFIDLDHFKRINDEHGHRFGDRVLVHFASALCRMVRESDIAGRYGGEEFVIIMPQTRRDQACALAERIRQYLAEEPLAHAGGMPIHVTASIGVAALEDADFLHVEDLIDAADQAMYGVKHSGRDGVAHFQD